jgi:cell wall assembly regulator SMI1
MGMKARIASGLTSTIRLKAQLEKLQTYPSLELVASKRVSKQDIRKAEKELGISLPHAYTDFVNTHGSFHFRQRSDTGRHIGGSFNELLTPEQIVRATQDWTKLLHAEVKSGSEIAPEVLENFVVFFHDGACNVAIFCPAKTLQGEMAVYMVYHDDLFCEWPPPSQTFEKFLSQELKEMEASEKRKTKTTSYRELVRSQSRK